jgi:two-component system copper resistance phosphate regulon response regulator CusR
MAKILLLEDNREEADLLVTLLKHENHVVDLVNSGEDALQILKHYQYDVLILDWELPGISGAEVCKQYRTDGGAGGVLMLTGRSDIPSKTTGLDLGSDDYLTKPYDFNELSSRIRALLRRSAATIVSELSAQGISFDTKKRLAKVGESKVELTQREAAVLEFLLRNLDRSFSSKALLDSVWPLESALSEDTVRSCMRHLRNKLAAAGGDSIIKTAQGGGYMIEKNGG